jgi:AbiV family abortive infection protein
VSESDFRFTVDLLREYSIAALQNASELLQEASLLYENGHTARAYFLGVASIEETGKALLAFIAQGRNLRDSAVTARQQKVMEDHSTKTSAAFTPTLEANPEDAEEIMAAVNLMVQLTQGREPSMYTDIDYATSKVQVPAAAVRQIAAQNCVHLAGMCHANAQKRIADGKPKIRTQAEDRLFVMSVERRKKLFNTDDFWWYYIAELQSGRKDLADAMVNYERNFMLKGKTFRSPE